MLFSLKNRLLKKFDEIPFGMIIGNYAKMLPV